LSPRLAPNAASTRRTTSGDPVRKRHEPRAPCALAYCASRAGVSCSGSIEIETISTGCAPASSSRCAAANVAVMTGQIVVQLVNTKFTIQGPSSSNSSRSHTGRPPASSRTTSGTATRTTPR